VGLSLPRLAGRALGAGPSSARDGRSLASNTGFRLFWTWTVRRGQPGRPLISGEVRDPIRTMCRENTAWGAPRIHGELLKLGIDIGETSVSKYMVRSGKPPSQTWRTFLGNHLTQMVSIDFFTVPTIRFQVLYVFLVLAHDRRRILHFNVTTHPTAEWTGQQLREAFPFDQLPRYLLRDRSYHSSRAVGADVMPNDGVRSGEVVSRQKESISLVRSFIATLHAILGSEIIGDIECELRALANCRLIVSRQVMSGKQNAESELKNFEDSQHSSDRHKGWRYFIEKTDLRAGTDPAEATQLKLRNVAKPNCTCENRKLCGRQRLRTFLRWILKDETGCVGKLVNTTLQ